MTGGDSARVEFKSKAVQLFQLSRSSVVVAKFPASGKAVRQRNRSAICLPPCGMSRMTSSIRDLRTWKVTHPPPLLVGQMPESICVPLFEVSLEKCTTAFKVLDKAKLPGAKQEELISLACQVTANANAGHPHSSPHDEEWPVHWLVWMSTGTYPSCRQQLPTRWQSRMVSKVRVFCALVNPSVLQSWILAYHLLREGLRISVRLSSAPTRQKTSETRYLFFKWLCESCDTNFLSQTLGRLEHLCSVDTILGAGVWETFGCWSSWFADNVSCQERKFITIFCTLVETM